MENKKTETMGKSESSSGVGMFGLTFLVFLVLKLTHVIDWSWWWVTAPIWGAVAFVVVVMIVAIMVDSIKRKRGKTKCKQRLAEIQREREAILKKQNNVK